MSKIMEKSKKFLTLILVAAIAIVTFTTSTKAITETINVGDAQDLDAYIGGVRFATKTTTDGGYLYCLDSKNMIEVVGLALQRERKNKGKWLWSNDEELADTMEILYTRVQEDYRRFVEADQLDDAERLANIAVKYFPKRAEYWNDLAGIYFYREDYKKALEYFYKALKLSPNDELIMANISYVEELLNQQK